MTKQRGFGLVETMVVVAILGALTIVAVKQIYNWAIDWKATKIYDGYLGLDDALNQYMTKNFRAMIDNKPVPGFASAWAPTIPELIKQGYLDSFVQTKFNEVGQLSFTVKTFPDGCDQAMAQCNIVYIIKPAGGVKSEAVANNVLKRLGPSGLINDVNNVNLSRSWNGQFTMPSPLPVKNALFVTRVFPSAAIMAATLPLDGSRPLTGDWNTGKALTGIGVFSTDKLKFSKEVVEGDPCTNMPGYKALAMGTNHYIQICLNGVWVHANEEKTIVMNTVIHNSGGAGWGGSGGSGGTPGYLGTDGRLYSDPNQENYCSSCNRPDGTTYQRDAQQAADSGNSDSGGSPDYGTSTPPSGGYQTNPGQGPGSGGSGSDSGDGGGE